MSTNPLPSPSSPPRTQLMLSLAGSGRKVSRGSSGPSSAGQSLTVGWEVGRAVGAVLGATGAVIITTERVTVGETCRGKPEPFAHWCCCSPVGVLVGDLVGVVGWLPRQGHTTSTGAERGVHVSPA